MYHGCRAGNELILKNGKNPVFAGYWMDFPESHWGITEGDYYKLSISERAKMEAKEQTLHYLCAGQYNTRHNITFGKDGDL